MIYLFGQSQEYLKYSNIDYVISGNCELNIELNLIFYKYYKKSLIIPIFIIQG